MYAVGGIREEATQMEASLTSQVQRGVTRADTLRAELEALIVDGHLPPGARLDENELANRFGVSRTPVREAIKVLIAIGLAEMRGRQGASVAMPSISTLLEMFEMMAMLEGMCAGFAARRSTAAERARLREIHAELVDACEVGEPERFYQVNARFHDTIYEASHTSFVSEQTWQLRRRLAPYRLQVTYQPERMSSTLSEHMQIIEAIEAADARAATAAASDHVRLLGDNLSDFIAAIQDGFTQRNGKG